MLTSVTALWLATFVPAHAEPAIPVTSVGFPTGFRVSIGPDPTVPVIGLRLVLEAGAAYDPVGGEGAAHLLEHLAFERRLDDGTTVDARLTRAGCTSNAFTSWDRVEYVLVCPSTALPDALEVAGALLRDPLRGVDEATFARERGVVVREKQLDEHEGSLGWLQPALATIDPAGPYARPIGGTPTSVPKLDLATLRALAAARYRPALASLTITGHVDPASAFVRAFRLLPADAFAPGATSLRLKRFQLPDGSSRTWPTESETSEAPLSFDAPQPVPVEAWPLPARVGSTPISVPLPGLDPLGGAVPGVIAVLPPVDEIAGGYYLATLASVVETELWEVFEDRAARGWVPDCSAYGLDRATVVVCTTSADRELGVKPTPPEKVAALGVEALQRARGGPDAVRADAPDASLVADVLRRTYAELARSATIEGGRLERLADLVHQGWGDEGLQRWLDLVELGGRRFDRARAFLADADVAVQPVIWTPVAAAWGSDGAAVASAPSRAPSPDVAGPAAAPPLVAPGDVTVAKLPNGLTVAALRWGQLPGAVVTWYGRTPTTAPPLVSDAVEAALGPRLVTLRVKTGDGSLTVVPTLGLEDDGLAVHSIAGPVSVLPGLLGALKEVVVGLGEGAQGSPLVDEVRRLTVAAREWQDLRKLFQAHERSWYAGDLARLDEEAQVDRALSAALGVSAHGTSDAGEADLAELAALDAERGRSVVGGGFAPASSVVVIAGTIDPAATIEAARAALSGFSASAKLATTPYAPAPRAPTPKTVVLWDEPSPSGLVRVETWCAAPKGGAQADAALRLVELGAGEAMYRAFRVDADLAYDPSAWGGVLRDHARLALGATVPAAQVGRALQLQAGVLDGLGGDAWKARHAELATRFALREALRAQSPRDASRVVAERLLRGVTAEALADLAGAGVPTEAEVAELVRACAERRVVLLRGDAVALDAMVGKALPGWTVRKVSVPPESFGR